MDYGLKVCADYILPVLPDSHLRSLLAALEANDSRLLQNETVRPAARPMPGKGLDPAPCEGADPIAWGYWQADGLPSVGLVEDAWTDFWMERDADLTPFFRFWDRLSRREVVPALAAAVREELKRREGRAHT